jgi:HD-GYP domain-containing protein (c-di-GMP phosphodiesterase class II)
MTDYQDSLSELNRNAPLSEKLKRIHAVLRRRFEFIDRIAAATYDAKTDSIKTYVHSSGDDVPLIWYETKLADAPSLREIADAAQPRVVNDLAIFAQGKSAHTQRIAKQGYGSSFTMPIYLNGIFLGFVFFNSYQKNVLDESVLADLDLFGHLVGEVVINELGAIRTLVATVQAARDISHYRDEETGAHLDRMSHYARLIARELAPKYGFSDEYIEHVFLFAPLHDVGKIGVPDSVLKNPGKLTEAEFDVMKTHTLKGRQIIDTMLRDFGLGSVQHIDVLRNIAQYHHETMDGTGYPQGLEGEAIPIEARIVAVADIFDALTNRRRYKAAWSNDEAFAMLQRLAGMKLDPDCVAALISKRAVVEEIQQRFHEAQPVE